MQGVGYRAWAIKTAMKLGLRGWVRNRTDGSVEMSVTGPDDAVAAMINSCRQDPPVARVDEIDIVDAADDGSDGFTARPTE